MFYPQELLSSSDVSPNHISMLLDSNHYYEAREFTASTLEGHKANVTGAAFHPSKGLFATCSQVSASQWLYIYERCDCHQFSFLCARLP